MYSTISAGFGNQSQFNKTQESFIKNSHRDRMAEKTHSSLTYTFGKGKRSALPVTKTDLAILEEQGDRTT